MPQIIRPRALAPGDTIAIAALSGGLETDELEMYERGVAELTALGFRVRAAPLVDVEKVWWWAAARPDEVATELNELFRDPEVRGDLGPDRRSVRAQLSRRDRLRRHRGEPEAAHRHE